MPEQQIHLVFTVTWDDEYETAEGARQDLFRTLEECEQAGLFERNTIEFSYGEAETHVPETRRWMVVDVNRTPIITGMHSRGNAQSEADRLNDEGLPEFRPYRVVRDVVADT